MIDLSDTLAQMFRSAAEELGLDTFECDLALAADAPKIQVRLRRTIEMGELRAAMSPREIWSRCLDPIFESVRESHVVKSALRELEKELEQEEKKLEAAGKEIERLRRYETYYELAYSMQHGGPENAPSAEGEKP